MAGFDENLVREYFELNGFLVRQLHKYQVHSRRKRDEEEIDLLVQNPGWKPSDQKPGFQLFANDLPLLRRAIVAVMGWHTSRLTPSMLRSGSKIHEFLRKEVIDVASEFFSGYEDLPGDGETTKDGLMRVLVLPSLPANDPLRSESIKQLQENGVDAILTFPSILENLVHKVESNLSYQKSDVLQMIRLLKVYDMLKSPQGDLFGEERFSPPQTLNMIHPTAIIHPSAKIGANVSVGAYAIVEESVELGEGCVLAAHAIVRRGSILGRGVRVDSFAVIGGDPQDLKFNLATLSGVRIGDRTVLREGATVHRSTKAGGFTEVGADVLLMGCSHVGHDCHVGARVVMANCALLAGHIDVGEGSFLSGGTVFHQFIRIGEGVMVSGNARLGLDVPPFTLAAERNELHGLNLVGLRRRGCDAATIAELKRLYQAVYQSGSPKTNAAVAGRQAKTELGKKFLAFFSGGKRGFLRPVKSGSSED